MRNVGIHFYIRFGNEFFNFFDEVRHNIPINYQLEMISEFRIFIYQVLQAFPEVCWILLLIHLAGIDHRKFVVFCNFFQTGQFLFVKTVRDQFKFGYILDLFPK